MLTGRKWKLTTGQNAATRPAVLASPHQLPGHFRIGFQILLFVFKSLNGLVPLYNADLLKTIVPSRSLRSTDQLLLVVQTKLRNGGIEQNFGRFVFMCFINKDWIGLK